MFTAANICILTRHAVLGPKLFHAQWKGERSPERQQKKHLLGQCLQGTGSIWKLCASFHIGQLKRDGRLGQQPGRSSRQAPFGRQNLPWCYLS